MSANGFRPIRPARAARAGACAAVLALSACTQAHVNRREAMELTGGGRAELGPVWMERYGCGGCHVIPGVPGARGRVGPALDQTTTRLFIAGVTENKPDNLITWIQDPQSVDSATAMPKTGVDRQQARDIAAYLYTLGH